MFVGARGSAPLTLMYCLNVTVRKSAEMLHDDTCKLFFTFAFIPPVTLTFCAFLSLLLISLLCFVSSLFFLPARPILLSVCLSVSASPASIPYANPFCSHSCIFTTFDFATFSDDQFLPPRCPLPSPPNPTFCTLPSLPIAQETIAPSFLLTPDPRAMWAGRPQTNPVTGGKPLLLA